MSQLNRDLLREVFCELIKQQDGFNQNVDTFMMSGKEPFKLVLDHCKKARDVDIYKNKIIAKLPGVEYEHKAYEVDEYDSDYGNYLHGTKISTKMVLFKPISIALASTIEILDINSFSSSLIPMLKSIKWETKFIFVKCKSLKAISDACSNIPNAQYVIVNGRKDERFFDEMKSLNFPCHSLTVEEADFNVLCHGNLDNSHLRKNVHRLRIQGRFSKTDIFHEELKQFVAFLSTNFPNLQTLDISFKCTSTIISWDWNDDTMARCFQQLPSGTKGCICFESFVKRDYQIDQNEYPDVRKNDDMRCTIKEEFFKNFPITTTLNFKLSASPQRFLIGVFDNYADVHIDIPAPRIDIAPLPPFVQQPKKVKFDKKKFSSIPAPIFKQQRTFKQIRNRFSR